MSSLEKHLLENRDELDRVEPFGEDALWQGIRQKLGAADKPEPAVSPKKMWRRWAVAASVAALAGWGVLLFRHLDNRRESLPSLSDISPEMAVQEARYQRLVRQKEEEAGFDQLDTAAWREIFQELEELEKNTAEARRDVPRFRGSERLVEVLKKHYELKIRILERLSSEIQKQKYHEGLEKNL